MEEENIKDAAESEEVLEEPAKEFVETDPLSRVEKLIAENNLDEAQEILNSLSEKSGEWHYVQAQLYIKKNWTNEARKQLKRAVKAEPDNEKYKDALDELHFHAKKGKPNTTISDDDKAMCAFCCLECSCEACAEGICSGCS